MQPEATPPGFEAARENYLDAAKLRGNVRLQLPNQFQTK